MSVGSIPTAGKLLLVSPQKPINTGSAGFLFLDFAGLIFP